MFLSSEFNLAAKLQYLTAVLRTQAEEEMGGSFNQIEEEGRRYLMMEQEEQGLKGDDNTPGAIDITALNSPTSSEDHTSGYNSADDDHLFSPSGQLSPGLLSPLPPQQHNHGNVQDGTLGNVHREQSSSDLLQDFSFMDGFLDPFSPPMTSVASQDNGCTSAASTGMQVCSEMNVNGTMANSGLNVSGTLPQVSQANFSGYQSPGKSTSFALPTLNDNFDSGDIEMTDATEDNGTNITVTLPPNINLQGTDSKSILLSVLKNADKTQLQKLNNQLTQALASIQTQGGGCIQPNIHISIESQPKASNSQTLLKKSAVSSPVSCKNITNGKNVNGKMSVGAESFPHDILGLSPGGDQTMMETTEDFSAKYSENMVNQRISDTMASIFADIDSTQLEEYTQALNSADVSSSDFADQLLNDVNLGTTAGTAVATQSISCAQSPNKMLASQNVMSTSNTLLISLPKRVPTVTVKQNANICFKQTPKVKTSTNTAQHKNNNHRHEIDLAAAKRGLDDHSYFCSKSPSRNNGHVKFAPESKARRPDGSVLEHFLTTKDPINPMRGSDYVVNGLSKLHIADAQGLNNLQPNLLKKLLTEDVGKGKVQRLDRAGHVYRHSGGTSSSSASETAAPPPAPIPGPLETALGLAEPGLAELDMLGTSTDMESLWTDVPKQDGEDELFLSNDVDEILREENRHQEEWMKHFLESL